MGKKMRVFNLSFAALVFICNIAVSYMHTVALFSSGGFHGWMAHAGAIGVEATFFMGAINVVSFRLNGLRPGWPAIFGCTLGVLLVGWSNIAAGWSYGVPGWLLGLATPISLVVAELIFSNAVIQGSKKKQEEALETSPKIKLENSPNSPDIQLENSPIRINTTPTPISENLPGGLEESPGEVVLEEKMASKMEILETPQETSPGEMETSTGEIQEEILEERLESSEDLQEEKLESTEETPPTPFEWALYLQKEHGKAPTRSELMEKSGCKEWPARQALAELKKVNQPRRKKKTG